MPTTSAALGVIPHGGPAIAVVVGCLFSAVIAMMVAIEKNRAILLWAIVAFVGALVVLSGVVDLITG